MSQTRRKPRPGAPRPGTPRKRSAPVRSPARRIAGGVARVAGFGLLLYFGGFVWFVATRPGLAPIDEPTDAVVVLTGGPGRLARGAAVLAAGSAKRMLVSGVGEGVSRAALAASVDAPAKRFAGLVDLGYQAVDTRSNAVETTAWVGRHGFRSLRLVTSSAHMRRARLELALNLPSSVRIVEDGVAGGSPVGIAREFNKYLLRRAALALGAA
ncbi:YdcF family protein [Polymorphobacter sp. PAMC 29334]|uniref:YdcF family protein n=1 Tax=Polymorphobacter sp. PAMC 29334 TaxID=2862331 RepID=UPI001D024D00|nr:YdcF family protein [Polymorphobacter sp. PAMC 29334]